MLLKESNAIHIPKLVDQLPEEGVFNQGEKVWYGGENSGGWCGWEIKRFVSPTNNPKIFKVYELEYFVNTSSYSRYEDSQKHEREYLVKLNGSDNDRLGSN